jgi:type II secretory pathway component GspD/PulD (secretin)
MRKKSLVFFALFCIVAFFPLYGCKSAEVKPLAAASPEVKAEAVQPAKQQPQTPVPAPAEQIPQKTPQKPEPVAEAAPEKPVPHEKQGDVSFNFDDADVFSVIQTIFGDVLKVNYIIDPAVKGRVNFRSTAPIAREDVLPLMEVILRINGIGIVEEGGLYRIVPISDISREPAPVGTGREAGKVEIEGKALVQVVPIRYSKSSEIVRILTPFLSKNALIVDIPTGNYIVIVDTDTNVKRLLQLVEIFDNANLQQVTPKVYVYQVQNSKAKDVASLLQQIFLGATKSQAASKSTSPVAAKTPAPTTPQPQQTPAPASQVVAPSSGSGGALVSEVTRIIPDEVTNTITILATPEDYNLIAETLKKIDIVPRQVMVEALIAEVTLSDNLSFGMQWNISNKVTLHNIGNNDWNLDGNLGLNTPISNPVFTYIANDVAGNIKLQLQSLASQNKAKILSSPHIMVSDNREARIQVGDQVPIATSTTTTTAQAGVVPSVTSTIQYKDTGTILKVKPQVNDSGLISLEVSQEVSDFTTQSLFGSDQIIISKREAETNLVVHDGQTIVIGGLIKDKTTKGRSGIPFLSKIPLLGYLFGGTTQTEDRTELIILLTPYVVRSQNEAGVITEGYLRRLKGVHSEMDIKKSQIILEKDKKEEGAAKPAGGGSGDTPR